MSSKITTLEKVAENTEVEAAEIKTKVMEEIKIKDMGEVEARKIGTIITKTINRNLINTQTNLKINLTQICA